MNIVVAGAGAGKTCSMAKKVIDRLKVVTDGKIIYVVTFTNAARDRIREEIIKLNGSIPEQVKVETIHVLMYREFITPFNHILFNKRFNKISQMDLPDNTRYKNIKIKELEEKQILHVERFSQITKWIICKKSGENKQIREKREVIISILLRYLDSIFIDEAQDLDDHFVEVIERLNEKGIDTYLIGDPKQDLRSRDAFSELIKRRSDVVEYLGINRRSPASHVELANKFISVQESQISDSKIVGKLCFIFESEVNKQFYSESLWDLIYITRKNNRFNTSARDNKQYLEKLSYELYVIVQKSESLNINEVDKKTYILKKQILYKINKNNFYIFNLIETLLAYSLSSQDKARLGNALDQVRKERSVKEGILINTIDRVKGLEGDNCLFVVTTDISPYLFGEKNDMNKMMNYLYVALTRSKKSLVFLITREVEKQYNKNKIYEFFGKLGVTSKAELALQT